VVVPVWRRNEFRIIVVEWGMGDNEKVSQKPQEGDVGVTGVPISSGDVVRREIPPGRDAKNPQNEWPRRIRKP